jgi:hypothetical protein
LDLSQSAPEHQESERIGAPRSGSACHREDALPKGRTMSARKEQPDAPALDAADGAEGERDAAREAQAALEADAIDLADFIPEAHKNPLKAHEYPPEARPAPTAAKASFAATAMRTARVLRIDGRRATIILRGARAEAEAEIAPEVETEVIEAARANGEAVLVEASEDGAPVIVAALHTRRPQELHIKLEAKTITLEATRELLLRAGRGAIRIRDDGDIEVVGTRISAASRGLFRIVGRILRLN